MKRSGRGQRLDAASHAVTNMEDSVKMGTVSGSKSRPREAVKKIPSNDLSSVLLSENEVPAVNSEEIVLNSRGTPVRQRKRNRFYTDDMISPYTRGGSNVEKVRAGPELDHTIDDDNGGGDYDNGSVSCASSSKGTSASLARNKPLEGNASPARGRRGKNTASAQRGRQPRFQLQTRSPEKGKRTRRGGKSSGSTSTPVMSKLSLKKIKTDPDEIVEDSRKEKHDIDKWGKLVLRADKLKRDREEKLNVRHSRDSNDSFRDSDFSSDDDEIVKSPGIGAAQHHEMERRQVNLKEGGRKMQDLSILEKGRGRNTTQISVLPPIVIKHNFNRATTSPTEEEHHHRLEQQVSQQRLTAVKKVDDTFISQGVDKRIVARELSLKLRNLLKLPKAQKWVCFEWFYSNIDKVLFEGENDFQICLRECFPALKTRMLTQVEWTKIRRKIGKPRRCSQTFFDEERLELGKRRSKIRLIQQRKAIDFDYKELPHEIPLQLVIGTKVTARLRWPQDGLFTGTVEGVDTSNNTYRITFDRPQLGIHSIPDYEVSSNEKPETVSTYSFALKVPRRAEGFTVGTFKFQNPKLLEDQPEGFPRSLFPPLGMLGGFPIRLLDMIVRLSKLLKAKREKKMSLKELNVEAEKMRSYGRPYSLEYRTRYAKCILDLESMNKVVSMYLDGIQAYCVEIKNDDGASELKRILDNSKQEASAIVPTYNCRANRVVVHKQKILNLIYRLTSLMLQIRDISSSNRNWNMYELESLRDSIRDMRATIEGKNLKCFQNTIEIQMNRIIAGFCVHKPKHC